MLSSSRINKKSKKYQPHHLFQTGLVLRSDTSAIKVNDVHQSLNRVMLLVFSQFQRSLPKYNASWVPRLTNGAEITQSYVHSGPDSYNISSGRVYGVLDYDHSSFEMLTSNNLVKRDDGDVWLEKKCSTKTYSIDLKVVTLMCNPQDNINSFINLSDENMAKLAEVIKADSSVTNWKSDVTDLLPYDSGEWEVAVSIFTTGPNYYTIACAGEKQYAMIQAIAT
ncbi:hypothetical protein C6P44_002199 [Monosporozyma unispora]|nr:hypothetical protein C6P44_002199 [Kazachstania unispora]